MVTNVSPWFQPAVQIVSNLAKNVSRVMQQNVKQWDGNQRRINAREVAVKNVPRNANHVTLVLNKAKNVSKRLSIAERTVHTLENNHIESTLFYLFLFNKYI